MMLPKLTGITPFFEAKIKMLWFEWWNLIKQLRPAFSRERTFLWFVVAAAAATIRSDKLGVTSFIRALALAPQCYAQLLDLFHSSAIKIDHLAALWTAIVLKSFPGIVRIKGKPVLVGDGIKIGKEGRKMPGVKRLHQESASNSKPTYIMGHSCQALAVLSAVAGHTFAVPLISRIHEGLVFSNRDKRTLMDKMLSMLQNLRISVSAYLVLDAFYTSRKMCLGLLKQGHHIICRVRKSAVAYYPAPTPAVRRRGRPKIYGDKILIKDLFETAAFKAMQSSVYGETDVEIGYFITDLIWPPTGRLVRFVLVKHPKRGHATFMTTDLQLAAKDIIQNYGLRFKIEVTFKQAIHNIGTYAYHFWMRGLIRIKRGSGNQHTHRKDSKYRDAVIRKLRAYHAHIQLGVIAQGMMQYLALRAKQQVWDSFGSWLRTIRPEVLPSEGVVQSAMRSTFDEFLRSSGESNILAKFIITRRVKTQRCSQTLTSSA